MRNSHKQLRDCQIPAEASEAIDRFELYVKLFVTNHFMYLYTHLSLYIDLTPSTSTIPEIDEPPKVPWSKENVFKLHATRSRSSRNCGRKACGKPLYENLPEDLTFFFIDLEKIYVQKFPRAVT